MNSPFPKAAMLDQFSKMLRERCPCPWYFDQRNSSGIIIKDSRGDIVWEFDAGSIPDEWPSGMREKEIERQHALANFLVEWSEPL